MEVSLDTLNDYYINYRGGEHIRGKLYTDYESSDIPAKNGMLHQVSRYTPLWQSEEPVKVTFDFTDYPEIASYIRENATEGQFYQQINAESEFRTALADRGRSFVSCYKIEMGADGSRNPDYNPVDYFTVRGAGHGWETCNKADQLILNLGYLGSIEMKTPIIIKGKYRVKLHVCYATTMVFMRDLTNNSNGGMLDFTFDGQNLRSAAIYGGQKEDGTKIIHNTNLGIYDFVLYDELEFDKTAAHTFKIVIKDPTASTNDKSRIQLDWMEFEPIID